MSMEQTAQVDDNSGFFDEDKEGNIDKKRDTGLNPNLYQVSLSNEKVKDGMYVSRGRFVKDMTWKGEDGKYVGKVFKNMYYLTDPDNTENKFYVECPSNWKAYSVLTEAFFYLWKHESATLRGLSGNFKQLPYWWSLFQIQADQQQPDKVGLVRIMRYGIQINDLITNASKDQPEVQKVGIDVMNTLRGKDFILRLFEKTVEDKNRQGATKKITSYEKSEFDGDITSLMIYKGKEAPYRATNDAAGKSAVVEYLKDAPSLREVESVKWDDATEAKVIESIRITIGDDQIFDDIINNKKRPRKTRVVVSEETKTKLAANNAGNAQATSSATSNAPAPTIESGASQPEAELGSGNPQQSDGGDSEGLPDISQENFNGGLD